MNKNINVLVEEILKIDERARKDDWYLIAQVIKKKNPRVSFVNLTYALEHGKDFALPSFESITRARRKAQKEGKYTDTDTLIARTEEEKEYREYYGG